MKTMRFLKTIVFLASSTLVFILSSCAGEYYTPVTATCDGIIYSFDNENKLATATGYTVNGGALAQRLDIPDALTTHNLQYIVAYIGDRAFINGSWKLVSISEAVVRIGDGAFAGCKGLEVIEIRGVVPPALGEGAFEECVYENAVLIADHQADLSLSSWRHFRNVVKR